MKSLAPELIFIVIGMLLALVGLSVWFGWWVAITVDGLFLMVAGAASAASKE